MRRFDLVTGAVLWQRNVGSDVNVSPAVGAGVVVVMDRGGTTTAFEQGTGKPRWNLEMQGDAAVVIGETVVVIQDQTAHALSTVSGAAPLGAADLRDADRHGEFRKPVRGGDEEPVRHLERRRGGHSAARTSPHPDRDPRSSCGLGSQPRRCVIARDGKIITRWSLPALTLALQDRPALATSQSVLLFSNDWTFQAWDDAG